MSGAPNPEPGSEQAPSSGEPRPAPSYEPITLGGMARNGQRWLYALVAVALAGLAFYMGAIEGFRWTSMYVAAPVIGAVWFALRLLMLARQ